MYIEYFSQDSIIIFFNKFKGKLPNTNPVSLEMNKGVTYTPKRFQELTNFEQKLEHASLTV